jgi:hypothetical protein
MTGPESPPDQAGLFFGGGSTWKLAGESERKALRRKTLIVVET